MSQWENISTAPKDGRPILVFDRFGERNIVKGLTYD